MTGAWLWLLFVLQGLSSAGARAQSADASADLLRETWAETMLAARALHTGEKTEPVSLGPWFATGYLPSSGFQESLFPESGVDLEVLDPSGKRLWTPHPEWIDGRVHDLPGSAGSHATYLFRTIHAAQSATVEASLGSDDGIEVFLRGAKILSRDVPRGAAPDQDRVALEIERGDNGLLLKIFNRGGGHGFYFSAGRDPLESVLRRIAQRFPRETAWWEKDTGNEGVAWLRGSKSVNLEKRIIERALQETGRHRAGLEREYAALVESGPSPDAPRWLALYARCAETRERYLTALVPARTIRIDALRRAIEDLSASFPEQYVRGPELLRKLEEQEKRLEEAAGADGGARDLSPEVLEDLLALQREALLASPLLDFDRLLLVR
ncbi:MAG: hypothetical protein JXA90_05955, partial [Planctomycetes bacterium]|nr:hypothetical protein [Planctomycetota bacterium]